MDAKPQRPLRALRLRDENVPPAAQPGKTLHQRNKSTPALSAMLQGGGVKAGVKRTAFADVSNTARGLQPAKDDMAIASKTKTKADLGKQAASLLVQEMSKPSALLRPAQRPISIAPQKAISTAETNPAPAVTKPRVEENQAQLTNISKVVSKRSTTIFRDTGLPAVSHASLKQTRSIASLPPVQHHVPQKQPSRASAPLAQTSIDHVSGQREIVHATREIVQVDAPIPVRRDDVAVVLDKLQRIDQLNARETYVDAKTSVELVEAKPVAQKEPTTHEYIQTLESQTRALARLSNEELVRHTQTFPVDEPGEYWVEEDDDEDEEYYDADGYTTARSFRSRGDNTTGAMTIVAAPRITARVQRELEAAKHYVESTRCLEDVEDEAWDTSMVAEYGDEIFDYMRVLEERMRPNPYYMDNQAEIQWSMRSVLMDWLVQVHHRFTLLPETLFLSVNYVDRFLSCKIVSLGKLQLVGATAIFVAAKYEEINCPSVQEIVFMVDGGYTVDEILKAERFMLTMLQFELGWPGPMSFLRRISKADYYDLETRTLAKYFLEITIMDERFVGCAPSFTAAGAHCLARLMLRKGDWSPAHVYYSNYTYSQLRQLISVILECCEEPQKHHSAVYEKYTDKRYKRASIFVETEMQNGFQLPAAARESAAGVTPSLRRK